MLGNIIKEGKPWASLSLIAPYVKRYYVRLTAGFLCLIVVDFLQLWIPRVIKMAVDDLQNGTATHLGLLKYGGYIILIALIIAALRYLWRNLILGFSRLLETHLRSRMFSHILTLDRQFFQRKTTGDIMALATNDLASIQLASGMGLVALIDAVVMSLAAVAFMAYIHPVLALIALAPMPILAYLTQYLSAHVHERFKMVQEQFSTLTEFARTTISSIRLIKAYGQEQSQASRFNEMGETYIRNNLKLAVVQGTLWPASGFIANLSLLLVLFFGGRMTMRGTITAGDFVAFITYLFMMTWPMMAFGWVANLFQRGITSLDRINALLSEYPSLMSRDDFGDSTPLRGYISVRNLSFTYANQQNSALKGITLDIRPGLLGIVGKTGSGKTTLCQLIARLYPVEDGTILFDGRDVNSIPISTVRSSIAYVPQDVILFSETIAFNISMGNPNAAQAEIEAAAKAAAIHDEIMAMKDGYQTRIGERGVKLSGGQRQRLALARALLLDRPILIIDDGLSAVDMETEHAIVLSLASYLVGRTCIIVSHRVAPLAEAKEIVVMDNGRIVAVGSHNHLMEHSPFYSTIYRHQTSQEQS
jgi:ATP-binding cassette subfamily B protein